MSTERFYAPLEVRSDTGGDGRTVVGIAVPYGEIATDTPVGPERFAVGAFKRSIGQRGGKTKVFRVHSPGSPVALAAVTDTPEGVLIESRMADTAAGDEALREVNAGLLDSWSVGFRALRDRTVGGVREVLEAALVEVSLVAMPAYAGARVTSVRDADPSRIELPPRPEVSNAPVIIGGVRWV